MTKPAVVVPLPPDAPGILHVDTGTALFGPTPTHDVGHEAGDSIPGRVDNVSIEQTKIGDASDDTIRHLAYALWEARGRPHGSSDVDWMAAEREVTGRRGPTPGQSETGKVSDGLGLMKPAPAVLEDGQNNPKDGRGPLRTSDDQGYEAGPH